MIKDVFQVKRHPSSKSEPTRILQYSLVMQIKTDFLRRAMNILNLFLLSIVFLSFGHPTTMASSLDNTDSRHPQRQYRRFLLPNQMKVFLISDPALQRGAASMTVGTGSIHDPHDVQGLAHFLEHMLFLGTEKYPDAGSYQKFVSIHDGFSNAFTAEEKTNYHFEIAPDHLDEALDRFSEFFVSPLFNSELVQREMKAVDSEHSKNLSNDFRRIFQVKREAYDPGHPALHFATGNLETLSGVTREVLLNFYQKHYSSNRMTLAVAGPQDLDTLQEWVAGRFNQVKNRHLTALKLPETFLTQKEQFRLMRIKTVKDSRTLTLVFPLPATQKYYRSRPLNMLGFLIGHEGRGSLLSLLKQEGLASGLSAGGGDSTSSYTSFEISIHLTQKGLKRYTNVIERVFQYLRLLREKSLPRDIYEEVRRMAEIDYRFAEKTGGTRLVNMFSLLMQIYPLRSVESSPFLISDYRPRLFDSMLFRLIPENMLALLAARELETDQTENYYGTEYAYLEHRPNLIKKWKKAKTHPKLALPEPNPFLPESLEVFPFQGTLNLSYQSLVGLQREGLDGKLMQKLEDLAGKSFADLDEMLKAVGFQGKEIERRAFRETLAKHMLGQPILLRNDSQSRIWYQQDFRFRTPKSRLMFRIHSPRVYENPKNAVLSQLYTDAITEQLNELGYPVKLAGLEYSIRVDKKGISLSFGGYSDRISELVKTVTQKLKQIKIDQETFESLKERRLRRYKNFSFQQPYQQAFYYRSLMLEAKKHSIWEYAEEISKIRLRDLKKFAAALYDRHYVEGFIFGNVWKDKAGEAVSTLLKNLGGKELAREDIYQESVIQIEPGKTYSLVEKMNVKNSAAVIEVQLDQHDPQLRVSLMVLDTALQPLFYNDLRTQQQLGYIVNSGMTELEKTLGMIFMVQSGKYDAATLEQRINDFLPGFLNLMAELPEKEMETLKQSVINSKLQKSTSLSGEAGRLYNIAFEHEAHFDYNSEEIKALEKLTVDDLRRLIRNYLIPERRRVLSLHMVGKEHQSSPVRGSRIESVAEFKKNHPCPESCLP